MKDATLGFLFSIVLAGLIYLVWAKVTERAQMRRTQAAYDAATEEGLVATRESLGNQRRMLALFEEMNATLKRMEERGRG